jgi:DNA-binding response OmpR family regulator
VPTRRTVLLVEDHEDTRDSTAELLALDGWTVRTADDGGSALASLARDSGCAVVILDWRLPDMDGRDILRSIRATPATANVPVIVVSAEGLGAEMVRAAGATAYLRKPFDPETLFALLGPYADRVRR